MRLYRHFRKFTGGSGWVAVDPSVCSATTKDQSDQTIEDLSASKAEPGRWFVETNDALYTKGSDYKITWNATIEGEELSRTVAFRHVSAGAGAVAPATPRLLKVVNDTTGSSITAHVASDPSCPDDPVHVLFHPDGSDYTSGGSVVGSGQVQITGLENNTWVAVAAQAWSASDANARSLPTAEQWVVCHDGTNLMASALEAVIAALRSSANLRALAPGGNWEREGAAGHVFRRILDGWVGGRSPARAPYLEVDIAREDLAPRPRGNNRGGRAKGIIRIRATAPERTGVRELAREVVRTLQGPAARYLGDSAHILGFRPSIGEVRRLHPVEQCEITLEVELLTDPGTTI